MHLQRKKLLRLKWLTIVMWKNFNLLLNFSTPANSRVIWGDSAFFNFPLIINCLIFQQIIIVQKKRAIEVFLYFSIGYNKKSEFGTGIALY